MATQADYSAVANALVAEMNLKISQLSDIQQWEIKQYLTPSKIAAIAGDGAKIAVDALDTFRNTRNQQT